MAKQRSTPPTPTVRARMRSTRRRDTPCELGLRRAMHAMGLRYRVDRPVLDDRRRRVDVVFGPAKVAVFVDGCFWHRCPKHGTMPKANRAWWRAKLEANWQRDRDTDRSLAEAGWKVLRYWEHEDPERAAREVARTVRSRIRSPVGGRGAGRGRRRSNFPDRL